MEDQFRYVFWLAVLVMITAARSITSCSCHDKWKHVLTTNTTGQATFGSKANLTTAVLSGSDVRILLTSDSYLTSVQNVKTTGVNVCGQALMHISKASYDSFQDKAYWWFISVCTTGQVQMNRYYVGNHVSNGINKMTYEIKWFIRDFTEKALSHNINGAANFGSVTNVIDDVDVGSDVRVVFDDYAATMNSVQIGDNKDLVIGQAVWHISQKTVTPNIEFQGNDYWWFTNWATDGTLAASRWQIGDHISRGESTEAQGLTWFTDNCWMLVYQHDAAGNRVQGSLDLLRSAVLQGHRVKVMFDSISAEPDEVSVQGGHVSSVLISMVVRSPNDIRAFNQSGMWDWRILTTTGTETTLKVNVGEYVEQGRTTGTKAVSWFIDSRPWVQVLVNSKTGSVLSGSKAALVSAVHSGARVRYVLSFDPSTSDVAVHEADNLAVSGSEVSAAHIRSVSLSSFPTEVKFQPKPYWWFTQSTTTGKVDMSRWTVGEHEGRGHTSATAQITWFANY
ncbi:uncharacterized protein LOC127847063 isoform X2 [Dreissena polymorpha]|uniref:Uncharacterized protein n=1 Tax=Dreissena polymorpha TaxID=45954 RepID=A0A9D4DGX4_DREPO|nr:uncharacterized protein LOC127847063 isoform X2 [Dreissena polymorpha]KAH3748728.1 hypothetical protein DPMN_183178 [Dreissena polymorpha]